jgi:hypothetical protein
MFICLKITKKAKRAQHPSHKKQFFLTKKAEPPPTRDVNRDSGTASANGGWLRRLVRPLGHIISCVLTKAGSLGQL